MKKIILSILFIAILVPLHAQQPGDTIKVKAFKYGSTTRDTLINFPPGNLTFDKIIMKYNMRCKNNLISTQANPNQGCGEWDYSCNTFIVDSTRIENDLNQAPSHIISNFTGTNFPATSQPVFDYYNFTQTNVTLNNTISETQYTLSPGSNTLGILKTDQRSGRVQLLFTATELAAAGLTTGNINGLLLKVLNAGGGANFLRVDVQQTTASSLNAATVTTTGFTNVYNRNYTFTNGDNRIQFHTPFAWNGTSNILVDISFTNTNPSNPVVLAGNATSTVMTLYAQNNYALELGSFGHVNLNASMMNAISNEITVAFWVYGNPSFLPANTSIIYGTGNNGTDRNLNIHLPWSNSSMYFDCGYSAGGYDRINKAAVSAEIAGQWNHWAFTKNAANGNMSIYLNGVLWQSGTALTKTISIANLFLGKDNLLQNNYKGKINELTIWNKELSASDIAAWMNKPVDNTHPNYNNLLAYYKMNEGTGLLVTDSKNNLASTGTNVQWTYDRGYDLKRSFSEISQRPTVVFLRGTYNLTTNTLTVKDSVMRNPGVVQQYSITNNASVTPMTHDAVVLVSTYTLNQASPSNIYNGDTGVLTGTQAVSSQSTITISNLPYFKRYPYYNEIMSFVTPYGKGLTMGPNGKSWYYDLTDFAPLLKGPKRLLMTMGGEYQEQMDLDFYFIVGTPPHHVVNFNQLWQGAARYGGIGIASINNDTKFNTQTLTMPQAASFKMRHTITGHGSQGEFGQNGGVITHYFNVNGGPNEFSWNITQLCSDNVVYPQGGTWVYTRQGWCPGQSSLLKEFDITQYVTPGGTVTLDYNCSNPQVSGGDYRYLVASQLVSYGPANRATDAAILDVLAPSDKAAYSRTNPVCGNPIIRIQNTGSVTATSIEIDYWMNNSPVKQTYTFTGSLAFMDTATVVLPINSLWGHGITATGNVFHAEIKSVNASADTYTVNNVYHSPFVMVDILPPSFVIEFKTNNNPFDNAYRIVDETGATVLGGSQLTAANTIYSDSYYMEGCYTLIVEDYGGDGLQWWANTAQGSGYVNIRDANNNLLKSFQSDFGKYFEYSFTTYNPLSVKSNALSNAYRIYPNPSHNAFSIEGDLENSEVKLCDVLGHIVAAPLQRNGKGIVVNTSGLVPGVYYVSISDARGVSVRKVIIN